MARPALLLALIAFGAAAALVLVRDAGQEETPSAGAALTPTGGEPAERDPRAQVELGLASEADGTRSDAPEEPSVAPVAVTGHELEVRARDARTGRPVPRFFVTMRSEGVALHAQGREGVARFDDLPAGSHRFEISGPEHEPALATATIPREEPLAFELQQRSGLRGVVRFADARPAKDVLLHLQPLSASADAPRPTTAPTLARTDEDGRYRFAPLEPGRYSVRAEFLGREVAQLGEFQIASGLVDLPDVRLEAGARLELELVDAGGLPRTKALVIVTPEIGAPLRRYLDEEGRLTLEPLPAGKYIVTVPAQSGHAAQKRTLQLGSGLHREVLRP